MNQKKRLLGIDLIRGIAAYAVILVHSGDETWGIPVDNLAISFRLLFYFAVPFFLAASFYFMVRKPNIGFSLDFWKSRLERIIMPYLVWSGIYLILRLIVFYRSNEINRLNQLIQDPLSIVFFGGASYHLYFLPLLLVSSVLVLSTNYFSNKRFRVKILVLFIVLSVIANTLLINSGNGFELGPDIAFQQILDAISLNVETYPFIRLVLVYICWILTCLPYFLTAIILSLIFSTSSFSWLLGRIKILGILAMFLIANSLGSLFLPENVKALVMAYSLLLFGISVSQYIDENNQNILSLSRISMSLGTSSFGIYLIHPIPMNFTKFFVSKLGLLGQVTVVSMLIISVMTFLLSWMAVLLIMKYKWSAKYMLGV